jgi:hypothetical protein
MRVPLPVLVAHSAIAANAAKFGPLGPPPQPTGPRGRSWATGQGPQDPILFVVPVHQMDRRDVALATAL